MSANLTDILILPETLTIDGSLVIGLLTVFFATLTLPISSLTIGLPLSISFIILIFPIIIPPSSHISAYWAVDVLLSWCISGIGRSCPQCVKLYLVHVGPKVRKHIKSSVDCSSEFALHPQIPCFSVAIRFPSIILFTHLFM